VIVVIHRQFQRLLSGAEYMIVLQGELEGLCPSNIFSPFPEERGPGGEEYLNK